jgi:hypothetical protein
MTGVPDSWEDSGEKKGQRQRDVEEAGGRRLERGAKGA